MKTSLTFVGGALLLAATQSPAQLIDNLYLDAGVGPALQQNIGIQASPYGNSGDVKFNPGVRGDIALGYNFTPSFAAEFETGIIWNRVHSIAGNVPDQNSNADIYEVPLLANVVYKPWHGDFQPYISVGCGGAATIFDVSGASSASTLGLFAPNYEQSDIAFAYQAKAGVKYVLSKNVEIGLAYQFLGTTDHNWSNHGLPMKTDGTMTHALMATFTWQF